MTFIIADDVFYARKAVEKMVLEWDADSVILASCGDGGAAADQIERRVPDVLITDIRMPGADGLSLAAMAQRRWPEMRIILVTGYAVFDYARQAISSGVCHYLLKPLKKQELLRRWTSCQAPLSGTKSRNHVLTRSATARKAFC